MNKNYLNQSKPERNAISRALCRYRRLPVFAAVTAACLLVCMTVCAQTLEMTDPFELQSAVDEGLLQEMEAGYPFEEAAVIVDPYQASPLTAVIIFSTDEETEGTITVKGKDPANDLTGEIPLAADHLVPVYGLYNGGITQVEISLSDGRTQTFDVETEQIDIPVGEITVDMIDPEAYDYGSLTFAFSLGGFSYALDSAGDVRWYYRGGGTMGVHPLENGHLMTPTSYTIKPSYYKSGLQEIDLNGRIYRDYEIPGGQHHDFQELPDGNLLVAGDAPDLSSVEDYVVEIDRNTGEVVWELDMKELLDMEDGMSASMNTDGTPEEDWLHNNSLWYDAENDIVLLSARHKDAIIGVHKTEKTLAWILGDPTDWDHTDPSLFFTPTGDGFEWFYAQHEITMLDNGDVMMFDNGTAKVKRSDDENRIAPADTYSRAVIYHIDTENMTVSQEYEYGKERGCEWYSDWISGVVSLDGTKDALWVTAGSHLYDPETDSHGLGPADMFRPALVKSTRMDLLTDGELSCEITITGDSFATLTFRSLRYAPYKDAETEEGHAGLTAADLEQRAKLLGNLGITPVVSGQPAEKIAEQLQDCQELPEDGSFTVTPVLDPVKLSVTGSYRIEGTERSAEQDYLVLDTEDGPLVYPLNSNAAPGEDTISVSVNGWVSAAGLQEAAGRILVCLDGRLYDTGYAF